MVDRRPPGGLSRLAREGSLEWQATSSSGEGCQIECVLKSVSVSELEDMACEGITRIGLSQSSTT